MAVTTQNREKLSVTELDFDSIKTNLKTFLQSKPNFTDYDFDASGLSVLLDLLAYNTHYQAMYLNYAVNELFIDSAVQRNSLISLSKSLGYVPTSMTSASCFVDMAVLGGENVDKYTKFITTIDGSVYEFFANDDYLSVGNILTNMELVEGVPLTVSYIVDSSDDQQEFRVPTANCDTNYLEVIVQEGVHNTNQEVYIRNENITTVSNTSAVFWLQAHENGEYEVKFGDDVFGKKPVDGNIVIINYVYSNGSAGNGARTFSCPSISDSIVTMHTTGEYASGGAEPEGIESIRFRAPRLFESQHRIVTAQDCKIKLLEDFSIIDSIRVWGGEEEDPPQYGKMFIAIKPVSGLFVTSSVKATIINKIKNDYGVVSIDYEVVDPQYTYIQPTARVTYDNKVTAKTSATIASEITDTISTYQTNNLAAFDNKFRLSVLLGEIDGTDPSIRNSLLDLRLAQNLETSTLIENYKIEFNNPLEYDSTATVGNLSSGSFLKNGYTTYFEDRPSTGAIIMYRLNSDNEKVYMNNTAGTIDYNTGEINIASLQPDEAGTIEISVEPVREDLTPAKNQIFVINTEDISVLMINEPSSS
jgi:hypothetical protein